MTQLRKIASNQWQRKISGGRWQDIHPDLARSIAHANYAEARAAEIEAVTARVAAASLVAATANVAA